jgi:hypothetical protein
MKTISMMRMAAVAAWMMLGAGCATEQDLADEAVTEGQSGDVVAADDRDQAIPDVDSRGVRGSDGVPPAGVNVEPEGTARALCIRTPFGPGEVKWQNHPASTEWRSEVENGSRWVGARQGSQDTDGIHRNGWGCTVYKIPDHCTLTVSSSGAFDCCCNAAASVIEGRCRWVPYQTIGAPRPPGC